MFLKILILAVFAVLGLNAVDPGRMSPLLDRGLGGALLGGALIFVAFEGFQLITNSVNEMSRPERNVPRGIYGSIAVTSLIYIALAIVAVGTMSHDRLLAAGEYALAEVAGPILGGGGKVLVAVAALMATASAINATLFGASRMSAVMAGHGMMPRSLGRLSKAKTPSTAVFVLTVLSMLFAGFGSLEVIASFSSMTFLLVSIGVSVANLRLARQTGSHRAVVVAGLILMMAAVAALLFYLASHEPGKLLVVAAIYAVTAALEQLMNHHARGTRQRHRT